MRKWMKRLNKRLANPRKIRRRIKKQREAARIPSGL